MTNGNSNITTTVAIPAPNTAPPARKVSSQNLANLLNGLELILNLRSTSEMTNDLIAIMTSMHNQLVMMMEVNATDTIKLYKALSSWFFSFIRGIRADSSGFTPKQWSLTHQCPTLLIEFMNWNTTWVGSRSITANPEIWFHLQVLFAFLQGHRVIVTPMSINTSTITQPLGISALPNYSQHWPEAMKRLGISPAEFQRVYKANCSKARLNIITTAGPNGQATWTADVDAKAILAASGLFIDMKNFCAASNMKWVMAQIVGCVPLPGNDPKVTKVQTPLVGRIHPIEEMGGKTRLVAILDYWTQAIMTPLHDTVAYFLRRLEQDGTFDQAKVIAKVAKWTADKDRAVNSFDLTAATDRIPIDIQVSLLTYLFGNNNLPTLWKSILVNRDFKSPEGDGSLRYAVGQPMGAKSSFPMLGLIHHALIQVAAINANVPKYSDYVVVGDDNTHANALVATKYRNVMESIGVPINLGKSVLHAPGMLTAAEFCKRVFVSGLELSAIPVKALVKTARFGHLAPTLQNLLMDRGNPVTLDTMLPFFGGLTDRRSVQAIAMLNKVPTSISGLSNRFDVNIPALDYAKWFENLLIDDNTLEHAFLYALITEQLKRVDGLLRGTILMAEVVQAMANPKVSELWPNHMFAGLSEEKRAEAIAKLPILTWSHPIHLAALSELDRVMSHLSGLRSGTKAMQDKARKGLLDILRNNLSEIWLGEAEKSATVRRSIFNAMLTNLKRMNNLTLKGSEARSLNFSVLLSHVQRMWSVHWEWGKAPVINAVKTRISVNTIDAQTSVDAAFSDLTVKDIRI